MAINDSGVLVEWTQGTDWAPEDLSWATKLGATCFFHSELVVFSTDGFTLSYSMERYPYEAIRKGVMVTLCSARLPRLSRSWGLSLSLPLMRTYDGNRNLTSLDLVLMNCRTAPSL